MSWGQGLCHPLSYSFCVTLRLAYSHGNELKEQANKRTDWWPKCPWQQKIWLWTPNPTFCKSTKTLYNEKNTLHWYSPESKTWTQPLNSDTARKHDLIESRKKEPHRVQNTLLQEVTEAKTNRLLQGKDEKNHAELLAVSTGRRAEGWPEKQMDRILPVMVVSAPSFLTKCCIHFCKQSLLNVSSCPQLVSKQNLYIVTHWIPSPSLTMGFSGEVW